MKKLNRILVWLGVLSLVLAAAAWAQTAGSGGGMGVGRGHGGGHSGGMGPSSRMGRQYDPQNLETVSGTVTQVQKSKGRTSGVHLQVKTDKETMMVLLGPASYLEQQNMQMAVGDKVEIKGSRIKNPRQTRFIASELKKGNQVVKLRNEQGLPLWSPRGPGGQ